MRRFAFTLFTSATLLFACQPMVARMIIPLLGGAPAVWILCSLCFQALVLGGYSYAHIVGSRLGLRTQVALQLALVISAFLVLPVVVDEHLLATLTNKSLSLGLLVALIRTVGLPFFVLATTSPLLQRWYAELGETDPYHLYAASNAGSMMALLGYPFLIEPFVALRQQSRLLTYAFAFYTLLVAVCALAALRKRHPPPVEAVPAPANQTMSQDVGLDDEVSAIDRAVFPPGRSVWRDRAVWLALAFVPSSLLMGATEFITTDLASVPLLWVVPLALYLASFIVAFAKKQVVGQDVTSRVLAVLGAIVAVTMAANLHGPASIIVGIHLLFLFVASVVCHRALAVRRPHHTRLTEFYLVMSLGGVLGGAFNGLVAPVAFDDLYEYPIAIGLALAARGAIDKAHPNAVRWQRDVAYGLGVALLTFVLVTLHTRLNLGIKIALVVLFVYVVPILAVFSWSKRPLRYAVGLAGILLVATMHGDLTGTTVYKTRDFFGVLKVRRDPLGAYLQLQSGSTLHGAQALDPALKHTPLTYYHPTGPAGDVLGPLPDPASTLPSRGRIGVIGLGVGSLAAYARPDERWTFFELNPRDVVVARQWFSFLSDVPTSTKVDIEVGDARLRLRDGDAARFDILTLDAFSSDAIPIHLMTREALAVYRRALVPGGVLFAHISNRHVFLEPFLAALAADAKMKAIRRLDDVPPEQQGEGAQKAGSHWVCLSDSKDALDVIAAKNKHWRDLQPPPGQVVWTDDFANVLAAMHF